MKTWPSIFIYLSFWLGVQACGPAPTTQNSAQNLSRYSESTQSRSFLKTPNSSTHEVQQSIESQIKAFYQSAHFEFSLSGCENPDECPPEVGLLSSLHNIQRNSQEIKSEVSRCTAFQISSSKIVTNSHCIPVEYKTGTSCSDYKISYRSSFKPQKLISCREIIFHSHVDDLNHLEASQAPDYAIIELDSVIELSSYPKLSKKGISEKSSYEIFSVHNSSQNDLDLKIKKQFCQPVYGSSFLPDYKSPQYSKTALSGCPIFKGNSGSPIFQGQKQIVGVIDSFLFVSQKNNVDHSPQSLLSLGTNFSCLNISNYTWESHRAECPETTTVSPQIEFKKLLLSLMPKLKETYLNVLNDIEKYQNFSEEKAMGRFEWMYLDSLDSEKATYTYELFPTCLRNQTNWIQRHSLEMSTQEGPSQNGNGNKAFLLKIPVHSISLKRNERFQAIPHIHTNFKERVVEVISNQSNGSATLQFYRRRNIESRKNLPHEWVLDRSFENINFCDSTSSERHKKEIMELKNSAHEEVEKFEKMIRQDSM